MATTVVIVGKRYFDEISTVKVLAFVDKNYIAVRRPRAVPFIISNNDFAKKFTALEQAEHGKGE